MGLRGHSDERLAQRGDTAGARDEEGRLRLALDACPTGVVMVDGEGTIVLANAEVLRMFGYRRGELVGRPVETLVPPRYREAHPGHCRRFAEDPRTRAMGAGRDLFGLRRDGSEFPVEIGLNPAPLPEGPAVLCSIVDITERKRVERRLAAYVRALQQSNETLEELAQVVSHDVRAPLRGIAATAQWLEEDIGALADPQSRENLTLLQQRATHLMELVEGVLRYSRAGLAEPTREPVDAEAVARGVIESLAIPEGVTVRVDSPLPTVVYDATQLGQVLQNLVANALQHMGRPEGTVRLAAEAEDEADAWRFSVRDTGVGIAEKDLERVFGLFQTLGARDGSGTARGLGLAIVKRIVERNGGTVRVRSRVGDGTEMSFTVPRTPPAGWNESHGG